ncbi:ABC transporter substrate-binding protein [Streptomyces beijiangensis]|uniref:ABC transporter substrate-binding protein n=1 Tax=Streptomyces beijiangensis TaxID=163361 RepID=A0A939JK15_9ACTN|nr:ABC transporter substrate-binding protein [Streptomyces beijiangensis]MBO0514219.1 ABC transporter substrate-binding protein [Streptomyces beijiangensis]
MTVQTGWEFSDDRGQVASAARRPSTVVAYIQAGATLWDHGVPCAGVFGSLHDGATLDRAKAGALPVAGTPYLGAGGTLDVETLLRGDPDLVVAVSYGGGQVYGLDPGVAKQLEEQVPVVVIDVGQSHELGEIRARFDALARSLGAEPDPEGVRVLGAVEERLRAVSSMAGAPRVLALSSAGAEQVHLARPGAWAELRALTACGVDLVEPPAEGGVNWSTVGWAEAAGLRPEVVLGDVRSNAGTLDVEFARGARVVAWNPEAPCTAWAHAEFLTTVAGALEGAPAV